MHPKIYVKYEKILSKRDIKNNSILEIGAVPNNRTLLSMNLFDDAKEKIGINLDGPYQHKDFTILEGNANDMCIFQDGRFDIVLCNAVLEHDKFFWKTLAEMRRVLKPAGLLVIGVPGYDEMGVGKYIRYVIGRVPFLYRFMYRHVNIYNSTITFKIHNSPGDYYRFSQQALKQVIFEGMENVEIHSILKPPRFIGYGEKPS